jgi:hypothetical protein
MDNSIYDNMIHSDNFHGTYFILVKGCCLTIGARLIPLCCGFGYTNISDIGENAA